MPAQPSKFSHEMRIRIKNVNTLDMIKQVYSTKQFKSINEIVNTALERGLPQLLDGNTALDCSEISKNLLEELTPITQSLLFNMKKITILQTVQESMISSLLQELEFYFKVKGITIDPALLDEFRLALPDRFEEDKQELIERLFESIETTEKDSENE